MYRTCMCSEVHSSRIEKSKLLSFLVCFPAAFYFWHAVLSSHSQIVHQLKICIRISQGLDCCQGESTVYTQQYRLLWNFFLSFSFGGKCSVVVSNSKVRDKVVSLPSSFPGCFQWCIFQDSKWEEMRNRKSRDLVLAIKQEKRKPGMASRMGQRNTAQVFIFHPGKEISSHFH